jgi:hypothetical protein
VAPALRGRWTSQLAQADHLHSVAVGLAPQLRDFDHRGLGRVSGARFVEVLTGQLYALVGDRQWVGFVVFAALGYLGLVLCYLAARASFPALDRRRLAALLFLLPGPLLWTAAPGSDACVILGVGVAAWGLRHLQGGRSVGAVVAGFGVWVISLVRIDLAVVAALALVVAVGVGVMTPPPGRHRRPPSLVRLALVTLFMAGAALGLIGRFSDRLDLAASQARVDAVVSEVTAFSGERDFGPPDASKPVGFVHAVFTVLFRPVLGEQGGVAGVVASLETALLLALVLESVSRSGRVPFRIDRQPLLAFGLVYVVGAIFFASPVDEFGLLTRQRAQLLPMVAVLLAVAASRSPKERRYGRPP